MKAKKTCSSGKTLPLVISIGKIHKTDYNSELLYNKNGILILTKTKKDKGTKGSESFETEIREYSY